MVTWMTTFGGIARFDGVSMAVFNLGTAPGLTANRFLSSFEDRDGVLWFGAEWGGLHRYEAGRFSAEPIAPAFDVGNVFDITQDSHGSLWLASHTGLYERSTSGIIHHGAASGLPEREIYSVLFDDSGQLWVGSNQGLFRREGDHFEHVVPDIGVWSITAMSDDDDLILGDYKALRRYRDGVLTEFQQPVDWVMNVARDAHGRHWLPAYHGIAWLDGDDLHPFLPGQAGLKTGTIRSVLLDREGSLWLGSTEMGLMQVWDPHFTQIDGLPSGTNGILEEPDGTIWMSGGCSGLIRIDDAGTTVIPTPPDMCVTTLTLAPDGSLWLAGAQNILKWTGQWEHQATGDISVDIRAMYFDEQGQLWLGTAGEGLYTYQDGVFIRFPGLEGENIQVITPAADGALWIGTGWGLAHITPEGDLRRVGAEDGFPRGLVRDILIDDDGTLWVGTYGAGMVRLSEGHLTQYTTASGLQDNVVSRILDDGMGHLWTNGNRGISRVSRSDLEAMARGELNRLLCASYNSGEGNGGSQPAGWRTQSGHLLFPTIAGAVRIDPTNPEEALPPQATITRMSVGGLPVPPGSSAALGQRDIEFSYTSLSLLSPRAARFRTRLVGYSDAWSDVGDRRLASFTNLPPGEYRFQVSARSADGVWSTEPAEVTIRLPHRFYERLWFELLLWGGMTGLVSWLIGRRFRQIRGRNRRLRSEIEARQRSERELKVRETHYRAIFERAANGFFIHNDTGQLLEINPTGRRMLETTIEALQSAPPLSFVDPDSRLIYKTLIQCALNGEEQSAEGRITWEGISFEAQFSATPYPDAGQQRVLITCSDLSEARTAEAHRQRLQERLQQAEKLNALGQLAGGIAHDFNNILTIISANAHIAALQGGEIQEIAEEIVACSDRGSRLVRQLLATSRQQKLRPAELNLRGLVLEMQSMFSSILPANITLELPTNRHRSEIFADVMQIERALLNLVINARDAMAGGGTLAIDLNECTLTRQEATQWPGARCETYVVLSIRDTGEGMTDSTRSHIFEPFFTTKPTGQGTGLGLSTVHGIIQQSRGFIIVESTLGVGTVFRLHLPLHQRREIHTAVAVPSSRPLVLLLCDDDPPVLRATTRALHSQNVEVFSADSAQSAIKLFRENQDRIEVLVTDVMMPGINGPQLVEQLRALRADLPVVFISGYSGKILREDNQDPLIEKPFRAENLLEVIRELLARSSQTKPACPEGSPK